ASLRECRSYPVRPRRSRHSDCKCSSCNSLLCHSAAARSVELYQADGLRFCLDLRPFLLPPESTTGPPPCARGFALYSRSCCSCLIRVDSAPSLNMTRKSSAVASGSEGLTVIALHTGHRHLSGPIWYMRGRISRNATQKPQMGRLSRSDERRVGEGRGGGAVW